MCRVLVFAVVTPTLLLGGANSPAAADKKLPPIKVIKGIKPSPTIFKASGFKKPVILRSEMDAAKYFSEGQLAKLRKQINFKQQFALVFAWRGSGQDRLTYDVQESFPEQIVFKYKPGRTSDLRPHVHVFALRSKVKWRTN